VNKRHAARDPDLLLARRAALRVLLAAHGDLQFDTAFDRELARRPLNTKDRALARTLAIGTIKLRRRLDFLIEQFVDKKHRPLPPPIQQVLRLGTYQLTELTRVPPFAAVSTSVELAKQWGHTGTAKLVNAVLRRVADHEGDWPWPHQATDPVAHLATQYSYPNWMVRMWLHEYGEEETVRRCKAGNRAAGVNLRLIHDTTWTQPQIDWLTSHHTESKPGLWFSEYRFLPHPVELADVTSHFAGVAMVQNESAAVATYLLDLKPGETALEIGSAPGGKIMHMGRFVGQEGRLVALDTNRRRMRRLQDNLRRADLSCIRLLRGDGRALPVRGVGKILMDVPCSGLGLLHRYPDMRWQKRPEDLERLAEIQWELLQSAARALPEGGRLVYSTCTTTREENEGQIARLLEAHPNLAVVDPRPLLPLGLSAGPHWVHIQPDPPRLDGAFACAVKKTAPA
jgi:16S rRNA (cytosine967-C5)-methyltransferase